MNNRPRIIALAVTTLIALCILLLLIFTKITVDTTPQEWPPRHDGEVAMADEEMLFDVLTEVPVAPIPGEEASPAYNPEEAVNQSDPAPTSGMDVTDSGDAGDAPTPVTSTRPAPVKQPVAQQPVKQGPSADEIARQQQDEARRRANAATQSAFQRSSGNNNTQSTGTQKGNSGSPNGKSASINGHGTGNAGGGWKVPVYSPVRSTVTGKIRVNVSINPDGTVGDLTFIGGTPPAYDNAELRAAVEREIRARRFTRATSSTAPDRATAVITYTFE